MDGGRSDDASGVIRHAWINTLFYGDGHIGRRRSDGCAPGYPVVRGSECAVVASYAKASEQGCEYISNPCDKV